VKGFSSVSTSAEPVAEGGQFRTASIPAAQAKPESPDASFVTASHEALFHQDAATRCDACNARLKSAAGSGDSRTASADDSGGYSPQGRAVYLWQRGGELHFESAPLCPACASAIGVTALARWEIEEEEG
jgi:hypothetical protein